MLFFTDRTHYLAALRVYANNGFDYSWRLEFPLLPESQDFIEELFSNFGSPVLEAVEHKKSGNRLTIPDSAQYFAAAYADPDWRRISAVVFSRKPLPDREHCRCQKNIRGATQICHLGMVSEEILTKTLAGKRETRKFTRFVWKDYSAMALAHSLIRAVNTKNMEAFDILFRLTELLGYDESRFPRIFAAKLTEVWQHVLRRNPPCPFRFAASAPDFRECIRSVATPEDFQEELKTKREQWLNERPILQKFFAENPADSYECDEKSLTLGIGRLNGKFRDAYNSLANILTREPEGLPELERFIALIREGKEIVPGAGDQDGDNSPAGNDAENAGGSND